MDLFFFGKYTNTPSADQSTSLSALTNNDLQIGIGTADNTGSNVNFAAANMKHVNGLAKIVLGTKTIPLTRTFYITGINQSSSFSATTGGTTYDSKGIAAYMQYYQGQMPSDPITSSSAYKTGTFTDADGNTHHFVEDSGSRSVKAAANFEGTTNRPYYHSAQSAYYAILKPSITTPFYSKDGIANGWGNRFTSNRINANLTANNYSSYTAYSDSTFIFLAAAYNYVGKVEEFMAPKTFLYKLNAWGASGGNAYRSTVNVECGYGGKGGMTKAIKKIATGYRFYVCVGGAGSAGHGIAGKRTVIQGGYNGGGSARGNNTDDSSFASGGGATHLAVIDSGTLNNFSLSYNKSIIMVAAGGGGAGNWDSIHDGGYGGGIVGGDGKGGQPGYGASQSQGGKSQVDCQGISGSGKFGIGSSWSGLGGSGGGGGLYGGGSGYCGGGSAGGGSGFLNKSLVSSGELYSGDQTFVSPSGGTETGHSGNGYAIISQ